MYQSVTSTLISNHTLSLLSRVNEYLGRISLALAEKLQVIAVAVPIRGCESNFHKVRANRKQN